MALSPDIKRVGDLLIQEGIILAEDIARAVEESDRPIGALAKALTGCGHASRDALIPILAQNFKVPHVDLSTLDLNPMLAELVPLDMAQKHELVPLAKLGDILCVAKANYFNRAAVVDLRRATGMRVKVVQCDEGQINAAMGKIYGANALQAAATVPATTLPGSSFMSAGPAGADEDALAATVVSDSPSEEKTIVDRSPMADEVPLELTEVEAPAPGGDDVELLPVEAEPVEAAPAEEEPIELEEEAEAPAEEEPVLEPEPAGEELLPVEEEAPAEAMAELAPIEEAPAFDELPPIEEAPAEPVVPQAPAPFFSWPEWQAPPKMEGTRFKAVAVQREEVAAVQLALKLDIPAEWEKLYVTEQSLPAIRMAK